MHTGENNDRLVRGSAVFLESLLAGSTVAGFAARFWDGSVRHMGGKGGERFTLVLNHPGALRRMFWPPNQLTLGEAFIYGDFDIEGDIVAAFDLADRLFDLHWGVWERLRHGRFLLSLPLQTRDDTSRGARLHGRPHSRRRDGEAVSFHYNTSNDFFRLWLDERLVYSCAVFADPGGPLDVAQERKLDYVCRKLRLQPGERLLDIGCGWGSLILHAAEHYGVEALGITVSSQQAELATERIAAAGLADRCRVELRDYRELEGEGRFDKLASVGMIEHVGRGKLEAYFRQAWRLLRPGGVFLNHGIASSRALPLPPGPSFIDRYVFPDGDLPPIDTVIRTAEEERFESRDLESLREHYALTLRHWVRRLEARYDEALHLTDEVTCRIWRLYMAGSAHYFTTGRLNVYQLLLVKPDGGRSGLPLSRADWYR